jgi:hypothetical protein
MRDGRNLLEGFSVRSAGRAQGAPPIGRRLATQRRLLCRELGIVRKTVGRTPWSARVPLDPLFDQRKQCDAIAERPTGGSAADQGVRPTVCAEYSPASKVSDIGLTTCLTGKSAGIGAGPNEGTYAG